MILIEHLTKRYGRVTAVDDLNLSIEAGQVYGLLSPNGAGKTTTVRIFLWLTPFRKLRTRGAHSFLTSGTE